MPYKDPIVAKTKAREYYLRDKEKIIAHVRARELELRKLCPTCGTTIGHRSTHCNKCEQKLSPKRSMLGRKHNENTRAKMSAAATGSKNPQYGKPTSPLQKQAVRKPGAMHPMWKGGISFEAYGTEFNKELKTKIRQRDQFVCQHCGKNGWMIHHIDYNKRNNDTNNLICLCSKCHGLSNHDRIKWRKYYENKRRITNSNSSTTDLRV